MTVSPQWGDAPSTSSSRGYISVVRPTIKPIAVRFLGKLLWVKLHWPIGSPVSIPCMGDSCKEHSEPPFSYGFAPACYWPDDDKRDDPVKCILGVSVDAFNALQSCSDEDYLGKVFSYYAKKRADGVLTHHFKFLQHTPERTRFYAFDVRPLLERMWRRSKHEVQRKLFTDHIPGVGDPALDPPEVKDKILQLEKQLANGFKPDGLLPPER